MKAEFAEFPVGSLAEAVSSGRADIGIGGMALTPRLAMDTLYSEPYLDETLAFVVRDHLRRRFETWDSIATIRDVTIGLPALPVLRDPAQGAAARRAAQDLCPE